MIENIEDFLKVALEDLKIDQHSIILKLSTPDADFNGEIVAVQLLAFSLVADEAMRGGK